MSLVPIFAAPGVCKVNSVFASGSASGYAKERVGTGRYVDMDKVRFVAGFPEKIGGWVQAATTQMVDPPRASADFRTSGGTPLLGIGTQTHLYVFDGINITDITPLRTIKVGTLGTNPLTTAINTSTVTVADATQNLQNGDWVLLTGATTFNNVTVNGWYIVSGRTGTGYTITVNTVASANGSGGGSSVVYSYPRISLTNPFTTVNGSQTVTVAHTNHGATIGDYVIFSGASAVGGLTLNGEFQLTVVNANSYTITSPTPATSGATGGGTVSVVYDITVGQLSGLSPSAYGSGPYGAGPFGYTVNSAVTAYNSWTMGAYGSDLIASPTGGTIYIYDPAQGGRAHPIQNAPISCLAIFITPERFLFALGISGNSMQLAWPDQNDITDWTTLPTNTANSGRSLQGGSFFVGGTPVANGVSLFFSDRCCFEASYTGDNEVYNTPLISDQSGLIGPGAVTTLAGVAYWMSDHEFWVWNGTVAALPSDDIRDYVFTNINTQYQSRSIAGTNRAKKEVWFFYPSAQSNEIDSYVIYHIDQAVWSVGSLQRTTWRDSSLFTSPYATDASGLLYKQEVTSNAAGAPLKAYITLSPMEMGAGDRNLDVFGFIPDFERITGTVTITVNVAQYPMDTPTIVGPFDITPPDMTPILDFRADGNTVGYTLTSNTLNGDFRLGLPRANVQPSGARL